MHPWITAKNKIPDLSTNSQNFLKKYLIDTGDIYKFFNYDLFASELLYKDTELIQARHQLVVPKRCQALSSNTHGGAISFYMDTITGVSAGFFQNLFDEKILQTRELVIEILKPVPTETGIQLIATVQKIEKERKVWINGEIITSEGVVARSKGFFLKAAIENFV